MRWLLNIAFSLKLDKVMSGWKMYQRGLGIDKYGIFKFPQPNVFSGNLMEMKKRAFYEKGVMFAVLYAYTYTTHVRMNV